MLTARPPQSMRKGEICSTRAARRSMKRARAPLRCAALNPRAAGAHCYRITLVHGMQLPYFPFNARVFWASTS
jgi:hypothetical protein